MITAISMLPVPSMKVLANWPVNLDAWFRALLQRRFATVPAVDESSWLAWESAMQSHDLTALVYHWLRDGTAEQQPPKKVLDHLQQESVVEKVRAAYRWQQLLELLSLFEGNAIPVIVLKGAGLSELFYPSPYLRPSADIDLLVREIDFPQVREHLLAAGYQSRKGRRPGQFDWSCEEEFVSFSDEQRLMVDVHWSLSPYPQVMQNASPERLFQRAAQVSVEAQTFNILSPADMLIHLALHLVYAHTDLVRLIWLYDIHLLAQALTEQDWEDVIGWSVEWQARLAVIEALTLAQSWLGTPFPSIVADLVHYPAPAEEYFLHQVSHGHLSARMKLHILRLRGLGNRDRLIYLLGRMMPDRQEIELWYPELARWPAPLAYLGRLVMSLVGKNR